MNAQKSVSPRRNLFAGVLWLAAVVVSAMALLVLTYFFFVTLVESDDTGQRLGVGYLLVFVVVIAVDLAVEHRIRRRRAVAVNTVAALNKWHAWVVRVSAVPLAVVAAGAMVDMRFTSLAIAVCIAIAGWLAFDVSTLAKIATRRDSVSRSDHRTS